MLYYGLAFLSGLAWVWLEGTCHLIALFCFVLIGYGLSFLLGCYRSYYLICIVFFLIGCGRMAVEISAYQKVYLSKDYPGLVELVVELESNRESHYSTTSGIFRVVQAPNHHWLGHRMRYRWQGAPSTLSVGQQWQIHAQVDALHLSRHFGQTNPYVFLFVKDIIATAKISHASITLHQIKLPTWWQQQKIDIARQWLDHKKIPYIGIALALAVGDRQGIDADTLTLFQQTGTSHLLAISGLHVGLVYRFFSGMGCALWGQVIRFFPVLSLMGFRLIMGLSIAWFYVLLSGSAWVTQRAFIMLCCMAWVDLRALRSHWSAPLMITVTGLLLYDPRAVLSLSFWFSVLAVFTLVFASHRSWSHWRIQWVLWCALLPLTYVFFSGISWVSLIANPVMIPWFSYTVVPVVVLGLLLQLLYQPWVQPILMVASCLLMLSVQSLAWLMTHCPWGWWVEGSQSWGVFLLFSLGAGLFGSISWRYGVFLCLCAWWLWLKPVDRAPLSMFVLDVGQGLSVLIETPHHALLYDTGLRYATRQVVLPMLRYRRWHALDIVMLSHGDADHAGGFSDIKAAISLGNVLTGEPNRLNQKACLPGMHWRWDEVEFKILYPFESHLDQGNHSSCVLSVSFAGTRILLTGDLDAKAERMLLDTYRDLQHDVLVVPHHGSNSASTQDFLLRVKPKWALISSGWKNHFNHPHKPVIERYEEMGSRIYNTAREGDLGFIFSVTQNHQAKVRFIKSY